MSRKGGKYKDLYNLIDKNGLNNPITIKYIQDNRDDFDDELIERVITRFIDTNIISVNEKFMFYAKLRQQSINQSNHNLKKVTNKMLAFIYGSLIIYSFY